MHDEYTFSPTSPDTSRSSCASLFDATDISIVWFAFCLVHIRLGPLPYGRGMADITQESEAPPLNYPLALPNDGESPLPLSSIFTHWVNQLTL